MRTVGEAPRRRPLRGRQDDVRRHPVRDPAAAHRGDDDAGRRASSTTSPASRTRPPPPSPWTSAGSPSATHLVLYLFGAPGQQRFTQLWQDMAARRARRAGARRHPAPGPLLRRDGPAGGVRPAATRSRSTTSTTRRPSPRRSCARPSTCCPRPRWSPATRATPRSSTQALIALVQYLVRPQRPGARVTSPAPPSAGHRRPAARRTPGRRQAPCTGRSSPPTRRASTRGCATYGPLAPVELAPGVRRHARHRLRRGARRCCATPSTFPKDARRWRALNEGVPPDSPVVPMMMYRPNCLYTDGDEHTPAARRDRPTASPASTRTRCAATSSAAPTRSSTGSPARARRTCSADYATACRCCVLQPALRLPAGHRRPARPWA